MRKAIVSANFGGYDKPIPIKKFEGWEAHFYTDKEIEIDGWIVHNINLHNDPVIASRMIKILTHHYLPNHDRYMWIDANMELLQMYDAPFRVIHPTRKCITQEAKRIEVLNKGNVYKEVVDYLSQGMPINYGLFSNGYFCRDRDEDDLHEEWFREYKIRDQISLPYVYWKRKKQIQGLNWHYAMRNIRIYDPLHNTCKHG